MPGTALDNVRLRLVDSFSAAEEFRRWLGERRSILGLDIETSGLSLAKDRIRLVQFGDTRTGWAIPWEDWRGLIRESIEAYTGPVVGHHVKFDYSFLEREGVRVNWTRSHDTMTMAFLANSMGPKGLKSAAALYVDPRAKQGANRLDAEKARGGWDWGTIPTTNPVYWGYAAGDTVLTALLAEALWPQVQYARRAYDLEMAASRVLCGMEARGVRIDVPYCINALEALEAKLSVLTFELDRAGINPNSPAQIIAALTSLGIPLEKRTENGNLSVDDDVLRRIDDPLARLISRARDLQKLISAYFQNFLDYRDDDLLHTHFRQLAARTGRMSCSEPALQQVPKESMVRDAFIPRTGNRIVLADYDNQELRVAAHFSKDAAMLAAFREGRDLHSELAARIFDVETPTKKQRVVGKRGRFSKLYGSGIPTFAAAVGLSIEDAGRVFRTISEMYPETDAGMAAVTRKVRERAGAGKRETGYISMIDGRRLRVPKDKAYVGFNYLIQGNCAIVMKQALVDLAAVGLGEYLGLSIHDEVYADVPEEDADDVSRLMVSTMEREDFAVPLTVSAKVVNRWGDPSRAA